MIDPRRLLADRRVRFLLTGAWNTVSAYLVFAVLFWALSPFIHYMLVLVVITIANVTWSFLSYKWLVFKTRGNYLMEYLRFYLIYAIPIGVGFVLFPFCIEVLKMNPYLAQAMIMVITVIFSYVGHSRVTFRGKQELSKEE